MDGREFVTYMSIPVGGGLVQEAAEAEGEEEVEA